MTSKYCLFHFAISSVVSTQGWKGFGVQLRTENSNNVLNGWIDGNKAQFA